MDLVKLEIDGKRVIADNRQTILEVALANGIRSIPTLCHDKQLEPFSCFLCVEGERCRTFLPACSTRSAAGWSSGEQPRDRRSARRLSR
jgi:NADH dehydrogenase/NADH:ubiquinone oxidoreductase subunit G